MKVAHLIDSLSWGGAQALLLTFAKTARQFDVQTFILGVYPSKSKSPLPKLLEGAGAKVVIFPFTKLYDPRAVPTIAEFLRKEKIDIIQTHLAHANIYGSMAGKIANIPSVVTLHNTKARSHGRLGIREVVQRYCLRNAATRVIAVGQNVANAFSTVVDNDRIDIIPNAVTTDTEIAQDERNTIRIELVGDSACPILIAVGRLTAQKGYSNMLNAFAMVMKSHPKSTLVIVGGGNLEGEISQQVASLGLENNVRLTGPRPDVPRLLAASDIFLNSSLWEGLSIAMLEAMAAGLPVVATSVGDAERLLSSGGGLLVKERDEQAFADAVIHLLDNPKKCTAMGQSARGFVEKNYSASVWFEKLLNTYAHARKDLS